MRRTIALLLAVALVAAVIPESIAVARDRSPLGVFGTINGKRFKATSREGASDPCVNGIFRPADGILVFAAIECKKRRRRQGAALKKNYKTLVMACSKYDPNVNPAIFPYEIVCPGSGYAETRTGRFRLPVSMTQWGANFAFLDNFIITSNVRMRIDDFDGTNVRGAIYGVFEVPVQGAGSAVPAQINGEVTFEFPVRVE